MKKILLLVMLAISATSYAQFKASPTGIVSEDGKGYYVVELEGVSAEDLYNRVEKFIIATYRNPDAVANKQPNEMINIHSYTEDAFVAGSILGFKHYADVDMNIVIRFKDGRMRIDTPSINNMPCRTLSNSDGVVFCGSNVLTGNTVYLFNKKGKVKNEKVIDALNSWLDSWIERLVVSVRESKSVNDEW